MAAPRCMRSLLEPVKRTKISRAPRPYNQTFYRAKSSEAENDDEEPEGKLMDELLAKGNDLSLSQRLKGTFTDLDEKEYKSLWKSEQAAKKRWEEWEPRTREDAERKWKELQNTPDHFSLLHMYKRAGVEPIKLAKERGITLPTDKEPLDPKTQAALDELRQPINVRAVNLRPLRRSPEYGVPVCDLQLRTYSIRSLLLFADFAVRVAYYMGLPARGPIPLPRITERWTVPRANFIFKKSQENFERITMRRLVQIQDGHPDVVKAWLAFLHKHQYPGVGMKANIWEFESLDSATRAGYDIQEGDYSRRREGAVLEKVEEILGRKVFVEAAAEGQSSGVELRP
ncbi:mitochondrial 37S ribosomal protein rsm10 [Coniothyrium glycines]